MPVLRIQMALTVHARGQEREAIRQLQVALLECQPDDLDRYRMRGMIDDWQTQIKQRRSVATGVKKHAAAANDSARGLK